MIFKCFFLLSPAPGWDGTGNSKNDWEQTLEDMCLNKVFRPDKLIPLSRQFLEKVFDWDLNALEGKKNVNPILLMRMYINTSILTIASSLHSYESTKKRIFYL